MTLSVAHATVATDFIYAEPDEGDGDGGFAGTDADDFASLPISELPTTTTATSGSDADQDVHPSPPPLPRRNNNSPARGNNREEVRLSDLLTATPDFSPVEAIPTSNSAATASDSDVPLVSQKPRKGKKMSRPTTKLETLKEKRESEVGTQERQQQQHLPASRPVSSVVPPRPSSLQQLQALDLFRSHRNSDSESFMLETEQYVQQMKRRRGEVLTRIDTNAGDKLRRKVSIRSANVHNFFLLFLLLLGPSHGHANKHFLTKIGYEIERRLVKATLARRKSGKKHHHHDDSDDDENPFRKIMWWTLRTRASPSSGGGATSGGGGGGLRSSRRRELKHRRYHRHHRFCLKCVTSSFAALFRVVRHPFSAVRYYGGGGAWTEEEAEEAEDDFPSDRTPTPKMLLGVDGRLQWPVFQV